MSTRRIMKLPPWQKPPLNEWSICGMNHYHVDDEKFLFVSMVKDGKCITEEGKDDKYLWNRLWHKADKESWLKEALTEINGMDSNAFETFLTKNIALKRENVELRGWHEIVQDCENLLDCPDTAESPQMSNLPNLVRDALMRGKT